MKAWLLAALVSAACSTPVKTADPPPTPPADDEAKAVAWQKENPMLPAANPIGMDWDKARKVALETRGAPLKPCDFRRKGLAPEGVECIGKRRVLLGALVIGLRRDADSDEYTVARIDIGRELVDEEWTFAVVDDKGFAVTPWTKPETVSQSASTIRFPIAITKIVPEKTHVIAKKEPTR